MIQPPIAPKKPHTLSKHDDIRIDPYYWMNERDSPEVLKYLNEENAYTDAVLENIRPLRDRLYEEMVGRIRQEDLSVPYALRGYWYYSRFEEGKEYAIYCRKKGSLENEEEIILDINQLAEGSNFCEEAGLTVSPDNQWLAYGLDLVGRRQYVLHIKNLITGITEIQTVPDTDGNYVWAADNITLFYDVKDAETLRTFRVKKHAVGSNALTDEIVFEEKDETFYCHVSKSKTGDFIFINSLSTLTSEVRMIPAEQPSKEFSVFLPRERDRLYSVEHFGDYFYITTNDLARNFRVMRCPLNHTERESWEEFIPHREDTLIEDTDVFREHFVIVEKRKALSHIRVIRWDGSADEYIDFGEPLYDVALGANPEVDSPTLRYYFTSLITPNSVYDYHFQTKEKQLKKQQEIIGGYDATVFQQERFFVMSRDGVEVPVSMVYKKGMQRTGSNPLLLYGYGSYGISVDPYFSSARLSLLNRGFIFVIAHIRGGQELGRSWYENGKLLKKKNTFFDFIDVGQYLVDEKYTSPQHLYAMGGSAGGLLMGAVMNFRPDLFNGMIAAVPFVDVMTTMLDESIPLTTGEFDEWGNPADPAYYAYMRTYSPYDNIGTCDYPNILVTTGYHDSQVQYWEPAKWVAKLREMKTDQHLLLFHCEMEAGHGGKSGRFQKLHEIAMEYGFLLMLEGIQA